MGRVIRRLRMKQIQSWVEESGIRLKLVQHSRILKIVREISNTERGFQSINN